MVRVWEEGDGEGVRGGGDGEGVRRREDGEGVGGGRLEWEIGMVICYRLF